MKYSKIDIMEFSKIKMEKRNLPTVKKELRKIQNRKFIPQLFELFSISHICGIMAIVVENEHGNLISIPE